jgi:hypothetical protein
VSVTLTVRPPFRSAAVVSEALWALAMAATRDGRAPLPVPDRFPGAEAAERLQETGNLLWRDDRAGAGDGEAGGGRRADLDLASGVLVADLDQAPAATSPNRPRRLRGSRRDGGPARRPHRAPLRRLAYEQDTTRSGHPTPRACLSVSMVMTCGTRA